MTPPVTRPVLALPMLVVLMLAAAFFAWTSADPFWLSTGRGHTAIATVTATDCQAVTDLFPTQPVRLVNAAACGVGDQFEVRVLGAASTRAYATDTAGLTLRWAVGLTLVVVCGLGIALLSGAFGYAGRQRVTAVAATVATPAILAAIILLASL